MTDLGAARLAPLEGSYLTPAYEHARVSDAMRSGVIACPSDTSMQTIAQIMATNHVHAVVLSGLAEHGPWAVVTDRDVLEVAAEAPDRLAGSCATTEPLTIEPAQHLQEAARLMREHDLSHLLVVDPGTGSPIGVLSTLDVAGIVGWGRG
jgi:CBS domain-containing protein